MCDAIGKFSDATNGRKGVVINHFSAEEHMGKNHKTKNQFCTQA